MKNKANFKLEIKMESRLLKEPMDILIEKTEDSLKSSILIKW